MANDVNKENNSLAEIGESVLAKELQAISELKRTIDYGKVEQALQALLACKGIILVTGSGTSSSIARRLAHVFTCAGLPAYFLDAGQSIHGYSAIISGKDVLISFSRGGETDEVNFLARVAREKSAVVISILENTASSLAALSDIIIQAAVEPENEPINTIPLSNTIIQAAVGDVLCTAINQVKGFQPEDFGKFHPGGAVGKRLTSK